MTPSRALDLIAPVLWVTFPLAVFGLSSSSADRLCEGAGTAGGGLAVGPWVAPCAGAKAAGRTGWCPGQGRHRPAASRVDDEGLRGDRVERIAEAVARPDLRRPDRDLHGHGDGDLDPVVGVSL